MIQTGFVVSASLAVIGLIICIVLYFKNHRSDIFICLLASFTFDILQAFQYEWVSPELSSMTNLSQCSSGDGMQGQTKCGLLWNKVFTLLTFVHICMQPFLVHYLNYSLIRNCRSKGNFVCEIIRR